MKRTRTYFWVGGGCLVAFLAFTLLVVLVDVAPVGPLGSEVGFSALNLAFFESVGTSDLCYTVSELLGYAVLLIAAGFAGLGACQLIRRRSILRVDRGILAMGALFVTVVVFYLLFELFPINYRPVLEEGELAASYPSTHTMLALTVTSAAMWELCDRLRGKRTLQWVTVALGTLLALTILVTRALSGVHWLTDIVASVLLSDALIGGYLGIRSLLMKKNTENEGKQSE